METSGFVVTATQKHQQRWVCHLKSRTDQAAAFDFQESASRGSAEQ